MKPREFALHVDPVVADLHRIRRSMFRDAGGDIDRYVGLVRAEARLTRRRPAKAKARPRKSPSVA